MPERSKRSSWPSARCVFLLGLCRLRRLSGLTTRHERYDAISKARDIDLLTHHWPSLSLRHAPPRYDPRRSACTAGEEELQAQASGQRCVRSGCLCAQAAVKGGVLAGVTQKFVLHDVLQAILGLVGLNRIFVSLKALVVLLRMKILRHTPTYFLQRDWVCLDTPKSASKCGRDSKHFKVSMPFSNALSLEERQAAAAGRPHKL